MLHTHDVALDIALVLTSNSESIELAAVVLLLLLFLVAVHTHSERCSEHNKIMIYDVVTACYRPGSRD